MPLRPTVAFRTLTEIHSRKLKDCGRYGTQGRPYWRSCPIGARQNRVIDGDTLRVDGVTYRLWGIDAPEEHQSCADGWPAEQAAT
jgi:endonuclease YncB( thermonuclease family)